MKEYTFGLCEARHEMPVQDFIFNKELDPTDFETMREFASYNIPLDAEELNVYVTGLTSAMLSVVDICEARKIGLTAYHYNKDDGEYLPQRVLSFRTCPFCGARSSQYGGWYCQSCGAT